MSHYGENRIHYAVPTQTGYHLTQQNSWSSTDSDFSMCGEVGDIKLGNFTFAFPGVQSWHPNPEPWFVKGGGPILDMGPYYYTMLVNLLGPAKSIKATSSNYLIIFQLITKSIINQI